MAGFVFIRYAAYAAALLLIVFGGFLFGAYVAGAVDVIVNDEPDKSWLFWGLALGLFGLVFVALGGGLAYWSWRVGKKNREDPLHRGLI